MFQLYFERVTKEKFCQWDGKTIKFSDYQAAAQKPQFLAEIDGEISANF